MVKIKTVNRRKYGKFTISRYPESQNFMCDRCLKPKIAKIVVTWVNLSNESKTICNACYGRLSSDLD